ncbi:PepSY domain-containing protein [Colwelliaceae bacterium 6471]
MSAQLKRFNRRFHFWAALIIFLPVSVVIGSGILLQVKKEFDWIQPPTQKGSERTPTITFNEILTVAQSVPDAEIKSWADIDIIDVRPNKGSIKIRSNNSWELQIDGVTGEVLSSSYRRSDMIESIHDGSFFHQHARLWLFLPAAIILFFMWLSGGYMLFPTLIHKIKRRKKSVQK